MLMKGINSALLMSSAHNSALSSLPSHLRSGETSNLFAVFTHKGFPFARNLKPNRMPRW